MFAGGTQWLAVDLSVFPCGGLIRILPGGIPRTQGPPVTLLPSRLWLIGLGTWAKPFLDIGFPAVRQPEEVFLVLQDFDFCRKPTTARRLSPLLPSL
jgi:hypothetical protein